MKKRTSKCSRKWIWGWCSGGIWPWCEKGNHWWKKGSKLTGNKSAL